MRHRSVFAGSFYNVLGQINDDKNSGEFIEVPFNIYRLRPSRSPGDWDMLGCQQYGPLLEIEIP